MNRTPHLAITPLFVAAILSLLPSVCLGQNKPNRGIPVPTNAGRPSQPTTTPNPQTPPAPVVPAPKVAPKGSVGAVHMADEPLRLEAVGLTVNVPEGTRVESARISDRVTTQLIAADGLWLMNIQTPQTSNEASTIKQAADQTVALLQGSVGVTDADQKSILETEAKILERVDSMNLEAGEAARLYISLPEASRKGRVVKGYTIFKPQPKQFVVFELICGEVNFPAARVVYEATVATARFTSSDDLMLSRMTAIKSGTSLLVRLSDQDWATAMSPEGKEQWYRMYQPSLDGNTAGEQEVGYFGIKCWRGMRGEIDSTKRATDYNSAEKQEGLLLRVRSRILTGKAIADNDGVFFMTSDRREEAWSFKTAARDLSGKQLAVASESGARVGEDLQIVKIEPGKPSSTIKPMVREGYISQLESFILPRLLAAKGIEGEFGWYAYESWPSATTTYRKDVVTRSSDGAQLTVTSTLRPDGSPQVDTFDATTKRLLGTELNSGQILREPIDLASLRLLWQKKNLPTDK